MSKIKSLSAATAILALLQPTHSMADKPYIGIGIGETSSIFKVDRFMSMQRSSNLGKRGFSAEVFAGYNYLIKESPLFIGVEIGARTHNAEAIKQESLYRSIVKTSTIIRSKNSLSAAFKMGLVVKDLLIYGKAGLVQTNFQMSYDDVTNGDNVTRSFQNFKKKGSLFGIGADYQINPNWAIGVDYTIASYPKFKFSPPAGKFNVRPSLQTTTFRLSYMF